MHRSVAFSLLLAATALPAAAQNAGAPEADEIIVTATKRAQNILDVPFSVNAQTQDDIRRSGATNLEDISRNVAGLTIQNLGPGQSQVSIRGVSAGQIVRDQPGVKEQVGVYLDESVISLSLFTPDLDLFDLNRVETLRGPQGTLFGSGSVGGTIRYITNQPNTTRVEGAIEADAKLVDGDEFGGSLKGAINLPLSGKVAVRAVGYYTRYGGFIDARQADGSVRKNVNGGERYGGRFAILFEPTDEISITPRLVYQKIEVDGFNRQETYNLLANPFTTAAAGRPPVTLREREQFLLLNEKFKDETWIGDLTIAIDRGPISVTSVTSYINRDILVSRDASALTDSVSISLAFPPADVVLPSRLDDTTGLESFSQELRFASTGKGPFQWVVGALYSDISRSYEQRLPTPGYDAATDRRLGAGTAVAVRNGFPADSPFNSTLPYTLKQLALFGEANYDITDALRVTAGVRYYDFKESRTFKTGGLFSDLNNQRDDTRSDGVNPRFIIKYDLADNVSINAQAAKGFRLGGVNDPLNVPLCTPQDRAIFGGFQRYGDESLWNYEGGIKAKFGGITANVAGFYNDISDLQVTLDAGSCSSRVVFNVPKAHAAGAEFELSARPMRGLQLGVSGSYINSEFDSTVVDGTGAVIGGIRKGNRLPTVPEFQIAGNATFRAPLADRVELVLNGNVQHVGSRFTQPSDQEPDPAFFTSRLPFGGATGAEVRAITLKLPAYQLVNFSAGVEFNDTLSLTAYVTNVFDENALLSLDRERGGRARIGYAVTNPRTYGVTVRKSF